MLAKSSSTINDRENRGQSIVSTFADSARLPSIGGATVAVAQSVSAYGVRLSPRALLMRYRSILVGADVVAAFAAATTGLVLRFGSTPDREYITLTLLTPVLWIAAVAAQGGYESRFLGTGPDEYRRLGDATLLLFAVTAAISFVVRSELSRGYVMITLPLVALCSVCSGAG